MSERSFEARDRLDGEVAVITGGTGAIGSATALRLARLGARVVLIHRGTADDAQPLLSRLNGDGRLAGA